MSLWRRIASPNRKSFSISSPSWQVLYNFDVDVNTSYISELFLGDVARSAHSSHYRLERSRLHAARWSINDWKESRTTSTKRLLRVSVVMDVPTSHVCNESRSNCHRNCGFLDDCKSLSISRLLETSASRWRTQRCSDSSSMHLCIKRSSRCSMTVLRDDSPRHDDTLVRTSRTEKTSEMMTSRLRYARVRGVWTSSFLRRSRHLRDDGTIPEKLPTTTDAQSLPQNVGQSLTLTASMPQWLDDCVVTESRWRWPLEWNTCVQEATRRCISPSN